MILLLLFWCLAFQDASWPELPPKLKENLELRQKYEEELQNGSPEQRRAAAQAILPALAEADPAAQADFLLGLVAREEVEGITDVQLALHRLAGSWNPFGARIEELLVAGAESHGSEGQDMLLRGALRSAGILELSEAKRVQAVAAFLDINGFGPDAREALKIITRHEFRDLASFQQWWAANKERSRTEWIASAADQATSEVVQLWSDLLASDPAKALDALQHERLEIRALAILRLASVPADSLDAQGKPITEVMSSAIASEVNPSLRADLVRLIPRVFPVGQHVDLLKQIVLDPLAGDQVRIAACESLVQARPVDAATRGLVDLVSTVYGDGDAERGTTVVRNKLLSSMFQMVNSNPAAADLLRPKNVPTATPSANPESDPNTELAKLEGALLFAYSFERSPELITSVWRLLGVVSVNNEVLRILGGFMIREDLSIGERQAAIEAYGAIVGRVGITDKYRSALSRQLDSDIEGIRFAAVGALANTKDPQAFVLLSERLLVADSEAMRIRLMKQLQKNKAPGTVPNLIKYVMGTREKEFSLYRAVLERNINGDVDARVSAIAAMLERSDYELAWRLDTGMPAFVTEGEGSASVEILSLRTRAQAGWALRMQPVPAADAPIVLEAFTRLAALEAAQPQNLEWPQQRAELLLRLADDAGAFGVFEGFLPQMATGPELDRLAAAALSAAKRASLNERAVALADQLKPMSTPEKAEAWKLLVDELRPVEPEVAGDPKGSPPPADDGEEGAAVNPEGTAAETPEELPVVEPGAEPSKDPEKPSGSGGGDGAEGSQQDPASTQEPVNPPEGGEDPDASGGSEDGSLD